MCSSRRIKRGLGDKERGDQGQGFGTGDAREDSDWTVELTVASSSTRMFVGVNRARASETSWRWPCDKFEPKRS